MMMYRVCDVCVATALSMFAAVAFGLDVVGGSQPGITAELILDTAFTAEDGKFEFRMMREPSIQWGPNNEQLIVETGEPGAPQILAINAQTGKQRLLASGAEPLLSPDGSYLAYRLPHGGLRIAKFRDLKLDKIADLKTDTQGDFPEQGLFAWAPDSSRVAFIRTTSTAPQRTPEDLFTLPAARNILVYDLASGETQKVHSWGGALHSLSYGPEGRIYFAAGPVGDADPSGNGGEPFIAYLDAQTGQAVKLGGYVGNYASALRPLISPTGKHLYFRYSQDPNFFNHLIMLEPAIINAGNGALRFFRQAPRGRRARQWVDNGQSLAFVCQTGAFHDKICIGDNDRQTVAQQLLESNANILSFAFSGNGQRLAWWSRDVYDTFALKVADASGDHAQTLISLPRIEVGDYAMGAVTEISWHSFDGLEIPGILILPPGYDGKRRLPLLVDVHGGPGGGIVLAGQLFLSSPLEWQMWAAKGYAVLVADYRQGQTVGPRDIDFLIRPPYKALWEDDALDVLAGANHLISLGIADPDRLVMLGHSAGSAIANRLATMTNRFALIVSKDGMSDYRPQDIEGMPGRVETPNYRKTMFYKLRATPETLARLAEESSPVLDADKVKSPFLYIVAEYGAGSTGQPRQFVNAINASSGKAQLLYLEKDHHAPLKRGNHELMYRTVMEWLDRYIEH